MFQSHSWNPLEINIQNYFKQDQGKKMLKCINGFEALKFTNITFNELHKLGVGGGIPIAVLNGQKKAYIWDKKLVYCKLFVIVEQVKMN